MNANTDVIFSIHKLYNMMIVIPWHEMIFLSTNSDNLLLLCTGIQEKGTGRSKTYPTPLCWATVCAPYAKGIRTMSIALLWDQISTFKKYIKAIRGCWYQCGIQHCWKVIIWNNNAKKYYFSFISNISTV